MCAERDERGRQRGRLADGNLAGIGSTREKIKGWLRRLAQFREPLLVLLPLFGKVQAVDANLCCFLAGLKAFALVAVLRFADRIALGRDASVIGGDRAYDFLGFDCRRGELDELHGDLKTIEKESGAAWVDSLGSELGEDLGERELDRAPIFDGRDDEVSRLGVGRSGCSRFAQAGVEVAERLIAQGR